MWKTLVFRVRETGRVRAELAEGDTRLARIHGVPVLTSTPETTPAPTLLSTSHGICARARSLPSSRMSLLAAPVTRRNTRVLSNARQPRTRAPATRSKLMAGALTGAGAAWQTTPLISSPLTSSKFSALFQESSVGQPQSTSTSLETGQPIAWFASLFLGADDRGHPYSSPFTRGAIKGEGLTATLFWCPLIL